MINELFKDMGKYLPSYIISATVALFAFPIVTRLFPPRVLGNYILVGTTFSILYTIVGWLSMSIIRFYSTCRQNSKLKEFYSTVITLTILTTVVLSSILLSILSLFNNSISKDLHSLMHIGVIAFIVGSCFAVLQQFLRAKREVTWYTGFSIWQTVASFGFGMALVMVFHCGVNGLLWGVVLSNVVILPLLWKAAIENSVPSVKCASMPLTLEMARYGFPLVVGNLAAWVLSLSDRYILQIFGGSHEVGIYSVSYDIAHRSVSFFIALFLLASWPIETSIWENKGEKAAQEFLNSITRYYLILCIPLVVSISALAKPVIGVLTAQEYGEGYKIVPLVAMGTFFLGLQRRFQSGVAYYKKTYYIMLSTIIAGLLNLGANFALVPRYGYMAAAVTTLISYVFLLLLMIIVSRQFLIWKFPIRSLGKATFASAIMGIVMYYIGNSLTSLVMLNIILATCSGVLVYFIMLCLLGELKPAEIQTLLALKVKIRGNPKVTKQGAGPCM